MDARRVNLILQEAMDQVSGPWGIPSCFHAHSFERPFEQMHS